MMTFIRKILNNLKISTGSDDKHYRLTKKEQHQFSQLEQSLLFKHGNYVKRSNTEPLSSVPVNVIAFYLPQFHCIPENDEWWGKGFTEWTNVRPALPLYENHYQPHIPEDELGYYDLLNIETQKKQIAMAKQYGITGFCYYFYWFDSHRLLEQPILNYLEHEELDLPFCLCWANENWSRRWDGRNKEILIKQNHSDEDDIAFISYIAKYLKDERYIRVDGKPLLIVYRPNLLPNIKKTVAHWRNWCRENGIGEIYLCCTHSFESSNPKDFDMDAAIEFPPNNTNPPNATKTVKPLSKDFSGSVYDWSVYLKRSDNYTTPSYKLFRGVCPSWDNTPRLKKKSKSFINSSPMGYQQWLLKASLDTIKRFNPSERFVFINAWNEWAEGAHLEPDTKYGFAWLEATKMALYRANCFNGIPRPTKVEELAIVIHAYYDELLPEIVHYLQQLRHVKCKLYITTPNEESSYSILENSGLDFYIEKVNNHGRDILPFLHIMKQVKLDGYELIIKVHTKKSLHRVDGDIWRQDLYRKLLKAEAVMNGIKLFQEQPKLGILGPDGHLVPMRYYLGSNIQRLLSLAHRWGISGDKLLKLKFVSGSMFMARVSALEPLLQLDLNADDFEAETGQIDGTMAHAIERAIAVSAYSLGFEVRSFNNEQLPNLNYKFAEAHV